MGGLPTPLPASFNHACRRGLRAACLLSLTAIAAAAAPAGLENLIRNSPFNSPAASAQGGARSDSPLEFRGMLVDRGEQFFSLYETATHSSLWVGVNEPGNPFKVQSFDDAKTAVTVEYQGRTITLPLKQAKIVALQANTSPMPLPGHAQPGAGPQFLPGLQGGSGPQPIVAPANANPAEEAARLSAVAEEIRRRRALRQQSVQQGVTPARPIRN